MDIRDQSGHRTGSVDKDGIIRDKSGHRTGSIDKDGTIRDKSGHRTGSVDKDGTIRNQSGHRIGSVDTIHSDGGSSSSSSDDADTNAHEEEENKGIDETDNADAIELFKLVIPYYLAGRNEKAMDCLRASAKLGYVEAQFNYGELCSWKNNVPFPYSIVPSGKMSLDGHVFVSRLSHEAANSWYAAAAEQGHKKAQEKLGFNYAKGRGVKKDIELAKYWLAKAAEQGMTGAQHGLDRWTLPQEVHTVKQLELNGTR